MKNPGSNGRFRSVFERYMVTAAANDIVRASHPKAQPLNVWFTGDEWVCDTVPFPLGSFDVSLGIAIPRIDLSSPDAVEQLDRALAELRRRYEELT